MRPVGRGSDELSVPSRVEAVTGDLHVRFVKPVPCPASVSIRAWVASSLPPVYAVRAELVCNKTVMAWAEAKFARRRAAKAFSEIVTLIDGKINTINQEKENS